MSNPLPALVHQLLSGDMVLAIVLWLFISWAGYRLLAIASIVRRTRFRERYAGFASQVGALLALEQAYEFARGQIPLRIDIAYMHAYRLLDFEWRHGFFVEARVERFFLQFPPLMISIELFYVFAHLFVTIAVIVWIYARRGEHYPFLRNLIVLTTAIALVAFYLYPTAPPRMLANYGLVDLLQLNHLVEDGGAQPSSYTYNPYAAMPSLHVAYAIVVSWTVIRAERSHLVRLAAVLYPLAMSAAVIISANHWVLDVLGAFVTVTLAAAALLAMSWLGNAIYLLVQRALAAARSVQPSAVEELS